MLCARTKLFKSDDFIDDTSNPEESEDGENDDNFQEEGDDDTNNSVEGEGGVTDDNFQDEGDDENDERFELNDEFHCGEVSEDSIDSEITFNNNNLTKCFICKKSIDPEDLVECSLCLKEAHTECYMKYKCKDCAEERAMDEALF